MANPQPFQQLDLSGGVQTSTSRFLRKRNEVVASKNADFHKKLGSVCRRDGYEQLGRTIQANADSLGAHVYRYFGNNKVLAGINDANNSSTTIRFLDTADYWTNILTYPVPNVRLDMLDFLDECYVVGFSSDTNSYLPTYNIDSTLTASTTRNVYAAPRAKFIDEFQNGLIAMNCEVNGVKYPDRFYVSSPALGFVSRIQNDQQGYFQQLPVDSARYLKAGMVIDIYSAGTNSLVYSGITIISVDKNQNKISFAPQQIKLKDNDEIWVSGRKNKLTVLWNTDYPTPESAEWKSIPAGLDADNAITAHGKNNNRKIIFTKNSTWKFDGANLVNISQTIGCIASETVQNIDGWTIWLHSSGVWAYNDATGQIRLLSRAIENYIKAINQSTIAKASAVVINRIYKLAVGEIAVLDSVTTSTSTSSTSTSSTSSSTSSTSTSSTSTSSTTTSTSTIITTTSTSSTSTSSTSTSSTSASTSSTSSSISTSSTSTSMSTSSTTTQTLPSSKQVVRLVYDFDSNIWWPEYHKREMRFQFVHQMNGYSKPYFTDETGRMWRDETGNLDGVDTIPFELQVGRTNQGTGLKKTYNGYIIQSENARGALVKVALDNGNWKDSAQITDDVQEVVFPPNQLGRDINYFITHNDGGDGPVIDGIATYFIVSEQTIG